MFRKITQKSWRRHRIISMYIYEPCRLGTAVKVNPEKEERKNPSIVFTRDNLERTNVSFYLYLSILYISMRYRVSVYYSFVVQVLFLCFCANKPCSGIIVFHLTRPKNIFIYSFYLFLPGILNNRIINPV